MTTTETVRTDIKLDRRWVSCGNQAMCQTMASIPSERLTVAASTAGQLELWADRKWLADELTRFDGPPGMELRTLDDDEILSPADYYAVLLRVPLPNSNDPTAIFPVGRLGYSTAAVIRDRAELRREVLRLLEALALHECREWLRVDGAHVVDPHPELN